MPDQLNSLFDEFLTDSMSRTKPPGVTAVRRTVARRYATRAIVLVLIAAGIALGSLIPFGHGFDRPPISPTAQPPQPSATQNPTPVTASAPPSPGPVDSTNTSPRTGTTDGSGGHDCNAFQNVKIPALLSGGDPNVVTLSGTLLSQCPNVQVRVVRATYTANGPGTPSTLTLYASTTDGLTAARPSVTLADGRTPPGTCYTYLIVTLAGNGSLPHTITNPIPNFNGPDYSLDQYWSDRGLSLISTSWGEPTCG
jgi:hypothetical protein